MNNNLSDNIKKIRKDNNLSQEQLAEALNVSRQAISKWESGSAYPEMEKLIQLSEKFNINIDDLLHRDIREIKGEEKSKKDLNKFIDSFLNYITDAVNLFSNMNFKSKIKCLFEQAFIGFILLILFLIIGSIGEYILQSILNILPSKLYSPLFHMFESIYLVAALIISVVIILHIFKTRYLDYYQNIKNDSIKTSNESNQSLEENITNNKIIFKRNENKIIIRDPKHSEYRFINGLFKLIILCIKFFTLFILGFLSIGLIILLTMIVASFCIYKTGIFFIGVLVSGLSVSVIDIVLILLLLNFIFTRKNDKKKMIWSFIISLITLGIGLGLITLGSLNFNYVERSKDIIKTETIKVDMTKDLFIHPAYITETIPKNIDNIEIEYNINKACNGKYYIDEDGLNLYSSCSNQMEIIRQVIASINKKQIYSLEEDIYNVKVYGNKENLKKLEENYKNYLK